MTARKADNLLRGDRTPAYVSRETGAAELQISAATWDEWVKEGLLPAASPGFPDSTPRWRWADVDVKLSGRKEDLEAGDEVDAETRAAFMRGAISMSKMGRRRSRRPKS